MTLTDVSTTCNISGTYTDLYKTRATSLWLTWQLNWQNQVLRQRFQQQQLQPGLYWTQHLQKLWTEQQQGKQTIDKPTNFANNSPMDIWITKDGSKRTNHVLQSLQPTTTRLNWQTTNNISSSSTNQNNDQSSIISTDYSQFTWLWWWLPLRLSKRRSMSSQTVLLRDYTYPDGHSLPTYDSCNHNHFYNHSHYHSSWKAIWATAG